MTRDDVKKLIKLLIFQPYIVSGNRIEIDEYVIMKKKDYIKGK